ncbi:MAG: RNase adapter RapZ [Oscillospiraceae bacterium]|nr:RNase adapter RapZ [Oscillospiraceae bacterium]
MEILVITGLSGGGKSKAASFLEDVGFYIVDNLPSGLILKFAEFCAGVSGRYDRVALVYDVRAGEPFSCLLEVLETLKATGCKISMLFLEASPEAIIKRYKETRRIHPLMKDGSSVEAAVRRELELLQPIRDHADYILNTTTFSTGKLRGELLRMFDSSGAKGGMNISVVSFGFKYGIPMEADLVFDVRFLPNPYYVEELRPKTGKDKEVYDYIFNFPQTEEFMEKLKDMISFSLPLYCEEGKTVLVIAVGCTGGHHRSVAVTRALAEYIGELGYQVSENHRDMSRN